MVRQGAPFRGRAKGVLAFGVEHAADEFPTHLVQGGTTKEGKVIVLMHDHMFRASQGNREKLADFIQRLKGLGGAVKFERLDDY